MKQLTDIQGLVVSVATRVVLDELDMGATWYAHNLPRTVLRDLLGYVDSSTTPSLGAFTGWQLQSFQDFHRNAMLDVGPMGNHGMLPGSGHPTVLFLQNWFIQGTKSARFQSAVPAMI